MLTLSIDAGLDGLGAALFEDRELLQAWYSPGEPRGRDALGQLKRGPAVWRGLARSLAWLNDDARTKPDRVVIETMKVYAGRNGYGKDPSDVLELQGVCGALSVTFEHAGIVGVLARDWKGQVKKPIMLARIEGWISKRGWSERVIVPSAAKLVHNAIDATGLGMVALGLEGSFKARD